jgi:uncharacterized protein (TIRG00374 family)
VRSLALKVVLTVALLALILGQVDVGTVVARFGSVSWAATALCLAIGLLQIGLLALRWVLVGRISGLVLPVPEALRCMLAAQFFSQGLPASVGGDALRLWWLSRLGHRVGRAARCVLLDRIAGLFSLFVLNIAAVVLLIALVGRIESAREIGIAIGAGIVLVAAGASRLGRWMLLAIPVALPVRSMRRGGARRTLLWLVQLQRASSELVYSRAGFAILVWGMGIHGMTVLIGWIIAEDTGMSIAFLPLLAVVLPVLLLSYLPFSVGGWGVREGAMAFALTLLGLPAENGVFLGLAMGALGLGSAVLGALVWLVSPMPVSLFGRKREEKATPPADVSP